jgi:hypothetical protein
VLLLTVGGPEPEVEGCAVAGLGVDADLAAVCGRQGRRDRQAEPGAAARGGQQ